MSTMILALDWVKANPIDCVVYISFACSWLVGLTGRKPFDLRIEAAD